MKGITPINFNVYSFIIGISVKTFFNKNIKRVNNSLRRNICEAYWLLALRHLRIVIGNARAAMNIFIKIEMFLI